MRGVGAATAQFYRRLCAMQLMSVRALQNPLCDFVRRFHLSVLPVICLVCPAACQEEPATSQLGRALGTMRRLHAAIALLGLMLSVQAQAPPHEHLWRSAADEGGAPAAAVVAAEQAEAAWTSDGTAFIATDSSIQPADILAAVQQPGSGNGTASARRRPGWRRCVSWLAWGAKSV